MMVRNLQISPNGFYTPLFSGVQYVHCVMLKCMHHGQSRGKRKTQKVCKNVNLPKTEGKFVKVGGKNNFFRNRGEMYPTSENRGKFEFVVDD